VNVAIGRIEPAASAKWSDFPRFVQIFSGLGDVSGAFEVDAVAVGIGERRDGPVSGDERLLFAGADASGIRQRQKSLHAR